MQNDPSGVDIIVGLACYGVIFAVILGIQAIGAFLLYKAADSIPSNYRQASPGQAFLFLIPLFNLVWAFMYPRSLSRSFRHYFMAMNQPADDCGEQTGNTAAILLVCGFIPCIGPLFSIAALVFIGMYLVRVWDCKGRAEQLAMAGVVATQWTDDPRPRDSNNPYAP